MARMGRPVRGAVLTTAFGFGAMMLAHHPGLHSFGRMAVSGLAVNLLVSLAGFVSVLALVRRFHPPLGAAPGKTDDCRGSGVG